MCPDWEPNRRPIGSQAGTPSTEPHQPGLINSFLRHANMTAVTIQSNKIVQNEVKDNQALLERSYSNSVVDFLATLIL